MDRIHPDGNTIIERLTTKGKVHTSGGGAVRAAARKEERAARTDSASIRGREMRSRGAPTGTVSEPRRVAADALPVTYTLNDRTDSAPNITRTTGGPASASIVGALSEINAGAGQTLANTTLATTSATRTANDGVNLISFVQGNYRFNKSTIAVNVSYADASNRIVDADTLFNPRMGFSTDDSGSVEQRTFDVQGIATHELMHSLGVPHLTTSTQATMYPSASPTDDVKMRTLETEDKTALQSLYPPPPAPPPPPI